MAALNGAMKLCSVEGLSHDEVLAISLIRSSIQQQLNKVDNKIDNKQKRKIDKEITKKISVNNIHELSFARLRSKWHVKPTACLYRKASVMAVKIAILNRKGGVGKTTTSLCLAELLHKHGNRTLLVDLDQQHNASSQYGAQIDGATTVYDLLTDNDAIIDDAIQHTDDFGDIIPGDDMMNNVETAMAQICGREFMLAQALDLVDEDYDYIIIDCPAALGSTLTNALIAANGVIVPCLCGDSYSVEEFSKLMKFITSIKANKRMNPDLEVYGALITMYEPRPLSSAQSAEALDKLCEQFGTHLFKTRIRKCCKVKEAHRREESLFAHAPECTTAEDYRAFAEEVVAAIAA